MKEYRIYSLMLLILLGLVSCQSVQTTPASTALCLFNEETSVTPAGTHTRNPTLADAFTRTPALTLTTPGIAPASGLHTAGPYLYLDSDPNLYGECDLRNDGKRALYELDGSGQREITFPYGIRGCLSPDMRWYAYISAEVDDQGALILEKGVVLELFNLLDGSIRKVADLLPTDYKGRQEKMVEKFISEMKSSDKIEYEFPSESDYTWWEIVNIIYSLRLLSWSPNSRYLAFPAMIDGNSTDVYLWDADTGIINRKEDEYLNVYDIKWSPDSQWILFNNDQPLSGAPISTTPYWSIHSENPIPPLPLDNECSKFSWISDTEFIGWNCHYGCGGDPPSGTDLFQINVVTGVKRIIWTGDWFGYAIDKENGTIILNAADPCKGEKCGVETNGIYIGPIFGNKKRISDARERFYDFMLRKGSVHRFLGLSNPPYAPSTYIEGITKDGKSDLLLEGSNFRVRLSPDYRWMAVFGDGGITIFDESDRIIFDWTEKPVFDALWNTASRSLYFISDGAVYSVSLDSLKPQWVFDCHPGACTKNTALSLILNIHLTSLPHLRAQPPYIDKQTKGKSVWSSTTFKDLAQPGTNEYNVMIPAYSERRWDFSWCATTQNGLEKILAPLEVGFYIGGEKIGEDAFRTYHGAQGGEFCRTWATLLSGWQPGDKTDLEIHYTLREAINDGKNVYPAGEYRQIIHVKVSGNFSH